MDNFVAVDFETGNAQRVSACALGYAVVKDGKIVESGAHFMKPVGGHAPIQTRIHGITHEITKDKPSFGELYSNLAGYLNGRVVGHSAFDNQVLKALSEHFAIPLKYSYYDTSALAKLCFPGLKNYKLPTVAEHLGITEFSHHSAKDDAEVCAKIAIAIDGDSVQKAVQPSHDKMVEYKGLLQGILADEEINYRESMCLMYWLEDNKDMHVQHGHILAALKNFNSDGILNISEKEILLRMLTVEVKSI